jgi:hypothetical protein
MEDMPQKASPLTQYYLDGITFPATKDRLVSYAEFNGANQNYLERLNAIPDYYVFFSPTEVDQAMGLLPVM